MWNASFKLPLFGCVISICCVGFASLDVVCDELNDCAWNCLSYLFNTCLVNTVFPELDGPETIIDQGCLNRVSNSTSIFEMINNAVIHN